MSSRWAGPRREAIFICQLLRGFLHFQLYRILFSPDVYVENLRFKRDDSASRSYGGLSERILESLVHNGGSSSSDMESLLSLLPLDSGLGKFSGSLIYEMLKDNPKLLLDPQFRHLASKIIGASGHPDLGFLLSQDAEESLDVLKV